MFAFSLKPARPSPDISLLRSLCLLLPLTPSLLPPLPPSPLPPSLSLPLHQVNLRILLVNGSTHNFLLPPTITGGEIAQHIFNSWPTGMCPDYVGLLDGPHIKCALEYEHMYTGPSTWYVCVLWVTAPVHVCMMWVCGVASGYKSVTHFLCIKLYINNYVLCAKSLSVVVWLHVWYVRV